MKFNTLFPLALFGFVIGDSEVSVKAVSPLEREVSLAEHAVAIELKREHAPTQIMQKEIGLLKNAENAAKAVRESDQSRHRMSLLSGRSNSNTQATIANKLEFAEHEIESALYRDHAPARLISEEKTLLGRASEDVHRASQLQTDLQKQYTQSAATLRKETIGHKTAQGALKAFKQSMERIVQDDQESLATVQRLEGQTAQAMQEAHVNASTQQQVKNLLAKVGQIEHHEVLLGQRSVLTASQQEQVIVRHASKQGAQQALKAFKEGMVNVVDEGKTSLSNMQDLEHRAMHSLQEAHANATTQQKVETLLAKVENLEHQQVDLAEHSVLKESRQETNQEDNAGELSEESLEKRHVFLKAKNDQLKQEHAKLLHEKELVDENSALEDENAKLTFENTHLRHSVNVVA